MVWHKYLKIACRIIFKVTVLCSEKCEPFKLRKIKIIEGRDVGDEKEKAIFLGFFSFLLFFSFSSSSQYLVTFSFKLLNY